MECIWPSTRVYSRKFNSTRVGNFDSHLLRRLSKIFPRMSDHETISQGSSIVSYHLNWNFSLLLMDGSFGVCMIPRSTLPIEA